MSRKADMIDTETGEWLGTTTVDDMEDTRRKKKYMDKRKSTDEFNVWVAKELGSFYFLFYRMLSSYIEKQYIFRFLYLCTYMDYSNNLLYGNFKGEGSYMREKDLQDVLKLSERETDRTKKIFIDNELLLITEDNYLQVNNNFCLKGKIPSKKKRNTKIRIFENAIKELYEKSEPREHKKLTLLISILPYINYSHNIVCYKPDNKFISQMKPMTLKDICKIVKYSAINVSRLKRELLSLRVGGELVVMITETDDAKLITINPKVYYKGGESEKDTLQEICGYFKAKNK